MSNEPNDQDVSFYRAPRNRWFHPPQLHVGGSTEELRTPWLELLYGIVAVSIIARLGGTLENPIDPHRIWSVLGLLIPVWSTWASFTFYSNRFLSDDILHRVLVFLQIFGLAMLGATVPDVVNGKTVYFSAAFAFVRFTLALLYARTWLQVDRANEYARSFTLGFSTGTLLWLGSIFLQTPWVYLAWTIAAAVDFATTLSRWGRDFALRYPLDVRHTTHRYGLLISLILGVFLIWQLHILSNEELSIRSGILCVEVLTVTFSLWWIYFDDVAHSPLKPLPIAPYVWIYSHLPLVASLSLLGSGIVLSLKHTAVEPLPAAHRWLLCGGLSATFLSIAAIDWVSERRQAELSDSARVRGRIVSGIATCVLAPVGMSMQPWAFVGLLASICILQLVIDMNVVPTASDMPIQRAPSARPSSPKAPERASRPKIKNRLRRDVSEAVRRGAPSEIRSDLYFFLMEGSWTRLLGTMVTGYLLINVVFGALYVLDSDSIVNAHPGSFLDAFFFSVQTMSTLGYGVLSPASTYSNLLVTIEAGTGLLLTALATGLMFAKVSRPRKAVLFSDVLTMTRYHGKKALMLRAGNARGNMLLEATARLSVLMEDDSPEGHQIRRLYDLKLIRDSTPVFALSWLMIHIIDEQSPLHGIESKDMEEKALLFIGILTGFDSTYAQTTHAQRIWYPEDIRFNSRFVDVVADLPDGRILIDYERFHDTHIDEPFTIEQNEFTPAEPKKS